MPQPFVLIHGAWHGGWCFDEISGPLRERGYEVETPDLPFTGAEDDVSHARGIIAANPGAVVLGHSYGGYVISHACVGLDVSHMVYLCAMLVEQEGQEKLPPFQADPALMAALVPEDGKVRVDTSLGADAFYHDCPPRSVEKAGQLLRPMVMTAELASLASQPPWQTTPATYVICNDDRAISPDAQRQMAALLNHQVEWDVSHSPFFARPSQDPDRAHVPNDTASHPVFHIVPRGRTKTPSR